MNCVQLIGRLARDVDLKYTPAGKAVCNITVAVDRGFGDNKTTDWIPVTCWEKQAEFVANYLTKGSRIAVEGRLQSRSYEKDGQKRTAYDVVAHHIQSLETKREPRDDRSRMARAAAEVQSAGPADGDDFHDPFEDA